MNELTRPPRRASLAAGHHDRAGDGHDEQHPGELEGEHLVAEQVAAELLDVGIRRHVVGNVRVGRFAHLDVEANTGLQRSTVARRKDRRDEEGDDGDAEDRRQRPLDRQRLDAQVLRPADAEQHDHEHDQHDDRPGVDDHLHDGEEVRLHRHEVHRDAEQRQHEAERRVDSLVEHDDADRSGDHHHCRDDEDEQLQLVMRPSRRQRRRRAGCRRVARRRERRNRARHSSRSPRRSRRPHSATSPASTRWC